MGSPLNHQLEILFPSLGLLTLWGQGPGLPVPLAMVPGDRVNIMGLFFCILDIWVSPTQMLKQAEQYISWLNVSLLIGSET